MARIAPWAAALLLIAAGLAIGLKGRLGKKPDQPGVRLEDKSGTSDEDRVNELLADRTRPWWQGHKLPMPSRTQLNYVAPDKMGSFNDPPIACPVMPLELARSLAKGRGIPDDHPLGGRPVRLIDMRLRSLHLLEHIPDSVNVPYNRMAESLKSGDLAKLDLRTVVIVYGDVYPHFDATAPFRVGRFEAYYCLEGGLAAWKARGYPVASNGPLAEYLDALNSEKVVGSAPGAPDPADIGPAALKTLLDLNVKPLVVFVGDEATFNAGHIPGAIRVTLDDLPARFEKEPTDRLIAVYCGCCEGSAKGLSGIAVEKLRQMKFTRLLHLSGHLKAWKDQGYPLDVN